MSQHESVNSHHDNEQFSWTWVATTIMKGHLDIKWTALMTAVNTVQQQSWQWKPHFYHYCEQKSYEVPFPQVPEQQSQYSAYTLYSAFPSCSRTAVPIQYIYSALSSWPWTAIPIKCLILMSLLTAIPIKCKITRSKRTEVDPNLFLRDPTLHSVWIWQKRKKSPSVYFETEKKII